MKAGKYLFPILLFVLVLIPSIAAAQDYAPSVSATIYADVKDSSGNPVTNATVTLDLYASDGTKELDGVSMSHLADGVYKYDYTTPSTVGDYVAVANATGYGIGTTQIHITTANCSVNASEIWSFNISGFNGTASAGGIINEALGGNMVNIITIGVLALIAGLFVALYIWKREIWVSLVAAGVWLCLGLFLMVEMSEAASPLQITDIWMALGWVCIGITIVCGLATFVWHPTAEEVWEEEVDDDENAFMSQYRKGEPTGKTRPLTTLEMREREKRLATESVNPTRRKSNFGKTGQV